MTVKFDRQHHHPDSFPAHTEARNAKIKILHRLNFCNVRRIRDKKVKHFTIITMRAWRNYCINVVICEPDEACIIMVPLPL